MNKWYLKGCQGIIPKFKILEIFRIPQLYLFSIRLVHHPINYQIAEIRKELFDKIRRIAPDQYDDNIQEIKLSETLTVFCRIYKRLLVVIVGSSFTKLVSFKPLFELIYEAIDNFYLLFKDQKLPRNLGYSQWIKIEQLKVNIEAKITEQLFRVQYRPIITHQIREGYRILQSFEGKTKGTEAIGQIRGNQSGIILNTQIFKLRARLLKKFIKAQLYVLVLLILMNLVIVCYYLQEYL